jgi:hypothetical protein
MKNGTVSGNIGQGISNLETLNLGNSILANSYGGYEDCINLGGTINDLGHNLVEDDTVGEYTCGFPSGGDPNLGPLQDNGGPTLAHALLLGSPAIDAGSCPDFPADQRGFPRPVDISTISNADDGCDIGAFEVQNVPPTISGTQTGQTVDDNATINPFTTVTIEDQNGDTLTVIVSLDNAAKGHMTHLGGFVESPSGTYAFVDTPASATTAIRGLTFNPTENRLTPGDKETTTFTISADDGYYDPVTDDTTTVIVTAVETTKTIFLPLVTK